jgi:hypothetical protein
VAFLSPERNKLTLEVVTLARYMIYFGFYDLIKLVELVKRLCVGVCVAPITSYCAKVEPRRACRSPCDLSNTSRLRVVDCSLEGSHDLAPIEKEEGRLLSTVALFASTQNPPPYCP